MNHDLHRLVVIPAMLHRTCEFRESAGCAGAKAGIQGLNGIGRQADSSKPEASKRQCDSAFQDFISRWIPACAGMTEIFLKGSAISSRPFFSVCGSVSFLRFARDRPAICPRRRTARSKSRSF